MQQKNRRECRKTPCRGAAWGKLAHINGGKCDQGVVTKSTKMSWGVFETTNSVYHSPGCSQLEMMMAKRPSSDGASWSASELKTLKKLASNGTAAEAAKALGRTAAAVQQKAMRSGISFRKSRRAPAKKK
jgi:hypothetical protein